MMNNSALVPINNDSQLIPSLNGRTGAVISANQEFPRTSRLKAPTMLLTGHEAEIFTAQFSPNGKYLATGSFDRTILLWDVYGDCQNWGIFKGHSNAVLEVKWSRDNRKLYSASADRTAAVWDVNAGTRIRKLKGHTSHVTCLDTSREGKEYMITGGDDGHIKIWDPNYRYALDTIKTELPVTALRFSASGDLVFSGSVDNLIKAWDLKMPSKPLFVLTGHTDTILGMALHPDGTQLLSTSLDQSLHVWNVKPFVAPEVNRCIHKIQDTSGHDFSRNLIKPCWSKTGRYIACGTGDRLIKLYEVLKCSLVMRLPGHRGTINQVCWHPMEPIVCSVSSDKTIFLSELEVAG